MKKLFSELLELLEAGEEAVLATIIASSGSTPRGAGSRMLVKKDGSTLGTVGGGAVEYRAGQEALEAMKNRSSCIKGFTLTRSQVADIGMVCGGNVVVYFQYMSPEDQAVKGLLRQLISALGQDEDSWLILDITEETCWTMGLYGRNTGLVGMELPGVSACPSSQAAGEASQLFGVAAIQRELGGRKYYVEPLVQAGTVYVFGGGHVAQQLVPLLAHVGFRCVVMDDRQEFAGPQVFPDAVETIVGDLEHISDYIQVKDSDYFCVMTRGHQYDYYVQRQALSLKPCYIGIMGSRNKIKVVTEKLLADGFSRAEIEACHMPIGTEIYAQTPEEIAVSIAGELIAVRAKRLGRGK